MLKGETFTVPSPSGMVREGLLKFPFNFNC